LTDFNWIPIIPLIGGFPLGAEAAFGKPPSFVASYDGFWANDSHYMNYQNNVLNRNLEYRIIENQNYEEKVNVIVGTPPLSIAA
jgi:hypothetical protein